MTRDQVVELLQLIRAHDNRTVDEIAIQVFAHAAARAGWTLDAAREAVLDHFATTVGEWLMPGHITQHIQASYLANLRALPEDKRRAMEHANYALQDMGYNPADAHRISRALFLGRDTSADLTGEQRNELKQRLAVRAEIDALPARHLTPLAKVLRELADQKAIDAA